MTSRQGRLGPALEGLTERFRSTGRLVRLRGAVAPVRGGLWRAKRAEVAERAARRAQRTTAEAVDRERAYRREFAKLAARLTPYIAVEKDAAVYILPTRQKFGVSRFSWSNWKEHRHLDRALAILNCLGVALPGAAFVDVGANVGTTIVAALRQFGFTSGYALEPEPANFRLLRMNLAANELDEVVESFNVAVAAESGTAQLALRSEIGSKHHLVAGGAGGNKTIPVEVVALDDLVEDGRLDADSVGLLWLDIEGSEVEALRGARTLLRRSIPIVMEFDPRWLKSPEHRVLHDLLAEHYTAMVDLRTARPDELAVLPFSALELLAERYPRTYTDLLVFRSGVSYS